MNIFILCTLNTDFMSKFLVAEFITSVDSDLTQGKVMLKVAISSYECLDEIWLQIWNFTMVKLYKLALDAFQ